MTRTHTYDRVARLYDLLDLPFEALRYRPIRPALFEGLAGAILDAGIGTGHNMPFYPPGARVTGIDISPAMLRRARARRDRLELDVALCRMDVAAMAFADDSFDHAVATFVCCVLPEDRMRPALRELARVVRPGGTIRLLDYRLSRRPLRRLAQRLTAPWVRWAYGAELDRDTAGAAEAEGLRVTRRRFLAADVVEMVEVGV